MNCCPLCIGIEYYFISRLSDDTEEEMVPCEVIDDDDD